MAIASSSQIKNLLAQTEKLLLRKKDGQYLPLDAFIDANSEDICQYSPEMLADIARHGGNEVTAWSGKSSRVSITSQPDFEIDGQSTTVISITSKNKPFLYDSIMGEITANGRPIFLALHPIITIDDNKTLGLSKLTDQDQIAGQISHIQIHLPELSKDEVKTFKSQINLILDQVQNAVTDWTKMLARLQTAIDDMENFPGKKNVKSRQESIAFLNWLRDQNFTFLGMREYSMTKSGKSVQLKRDKSNGLGILKDPDLAILRIGPTPVVSTPEIIDFLNGKDQLIVTKSNLRSVVHRRTYMDYIGVKKYDDKGNVCGELRIIGLFTSTAYTRSVTSIPLLRSKIDNVVTKFGYDPESHLGKSLLNVLESYPRDELFQINQNLLYQFCQQIIDIEERPRIRVLTRIDQFDRFVSIVVFVPRIQYNSSVREKIGNYLKTLYGDRVSAFYPSFPSEAITRVHFIIGRSGGKTPNIDQSLIEQDIGKIAARWEDKFANLAKDSSNKIAINQSFKEHFSPEETFADLPHLSCCANSNQTQVKFIKREADLDDQLSIKIFHGKTPLSLSRRVPLLENFGFNVISEQTHHVDVKDNNGQLQTIVVHDMELELSQQTDLDVENDRERLIEAFLSVWEDIADNDEFNRLITLTKLTIKQILVIRALSRYLLQTGITYSQSYMAECLVKYPDIAALIFKLFEYRFSPHINAQLRDKNQSAILDEIHANLDQVPSLDDDLIIKRFTNLICGILRTNYFHERDNNQQNTVLAFKLDPKKLDNLPAPVPYREIFVFGTEVEGVHLRFGPVARGGLRWSDRAEDYRTEVLGLVKAQQVKNAVIVPVGSKGGFYPRKLPIGASRDAIFEAGRDAYKLFIGTMLSITDNIVGTGIISPPNTICHDGDDPYFVVAADKGTATFSDTANAISQAHGFWLDDAFASGGSAGYDHKKMGITAKGAWEAVKRHFREMNTDIQKDPFTVVGIGDMSGDVFGNGMLLSTKIRLLAAFDHRDIFIDPDPDCDLTFQERKRLFGLGRSSWQDYDKSLLSKGGMIISRAEKSIKLTPEVKALLGMSAQIATPFEILTAILKMPSDLLWFGGIGTYIKDESENHTEVGDRANDSIRINADQVGAKVIGEGANLGITQKARIAFSAKGGRCNSDAIDNSAGVNSSDVEVNIKIALANAVQDDRLDIKSRNKLLSAMTKNVSDLVLRNNYLQTLAISLIEKRSLQTGNELARFMNSLEAAGQLNRSVETLPSDHELKERMVSNLPLVRPEIGVLLSYAKIDLYEKILASSLPDDPYFTDQLEAYFPVKMLVDHKDDIHSHRLRREIISTLIINDAINRGGPAFITEMMDQAGVQPETIVKRYILVRDGLKFNDIFDQIDKLDNKVPGEHQNLAYEIVCKIIIQTTAKVLHIDGFEGDLSASTHQLTNAYIKLSAKTGDDLPQYLKDEISSTENTLLDAQVPRKLAKSIAAFKWLSSIPDITHLALQTETDLEKCAQAFFKIADHIQVGKIESAADRIVPNDIYETRAQRRAIEDLLDAQKSMTLSALTTYAKNPDPGNAWISQNKADIDAAKSQIDDILDQAGLTVVKLMIISSLIKDLAKE